MPKVVPPTELVIPARNEALHIDATLRSLHVQELIGTDEKYAITVVVNACSDRTAEQAEETVETLAPRPELRYSIVEETEPGKNNAINSRLEASNSEHFMYMDADVVLSPRGLRRVSENLRRKGVMISGALTRTVIPEEIATTAFGKLLRVWQLKQEIVAAPTLPTGRMMAFHRGAIKALPIEMDVAEDRYITLSVMRDYGISAVKVAEGAFVYPNAPRTWEEFVDQRARYVGGMRYLLEQYPELKPVFKRVQAAQRSEYRPKSYSEIIEDLTRRMIIEQIDPARIKELEFLEGDIRVRAASLQTSGIISSDGRWAPAVSTKIPADVKSVLVT